jgi:hypothetical protein
VNQKPGLRIEVQSHLANRLLLLLPAVAQGRTAKTALSAIGKRTLEKSLSTNALSRKNRGIGYNDSLSMLVLVLH